MLTRDLFPVANFLVIIVFVLGYFENDLDCVEWDVKV